MVSQRFTCSWRLQSSRVRLIGLILRWGFSTPGETHLQAPPRTLIVSGTHVRLCFGVYNIDYLSGVLMDGFVSRTSVFMCSHTNMANLGIFKNSDYPLWALSIVYKTTAFMSARTNVSIHPLHAPLSGAHAHTRLLKITSQKYNTTFCRKTPQTSWH